jgi:signal transduction histidine kinase
MGEIKVYSQILSDSNKIMITVEDNGVGMSKEKIKEILAGNTTSTLGTSDEKGTGLGLMICKEFIAQINGEFLKRER